LETPSLDPSSSSSEKWGCWSRGLGDGIVEVLIGNKRFVFPSSSFHHLFISFCLEDRKRDKGVWGEEDSD